MKKYFFLLIILVLISIYYFLRNPMGVDKNSSLISINKTEFGTLKNGTVVYKYTLENKIGTKVSIITYGGIITNLKTFNKLGALEDIVLGYNSLEEYIKESPYFGAIIGRYGNRISKGKFSINGKEYNLARNDGQNHLHGGNIGFDKVIWDATTQTDKNSASLILSYTSGDMEEGYPGNLETKVIYTLNNENSIEVLYEAITDKPTIINLTQHSYFNLSGDFSESILDHEVKINANAFLPVDETLIPTGEIVNVESTPFDFRKFKRIGKDINFENEQLIIGNGYDHCWILNDYGTMRFVAAAYHSRSGRFLEVYSDEPGMQFYSGNFLDGTLPRRDEGYYGNRSGFCFETQHYPNSPNNKEFPSVILEPNELYTSRTTFNFSLK